jgi:UDP-xylose/UDP-N-acetylglucosamine transporter B4
LIGAFIVFFAGGLYGLEGSKNSGRARHRVSIGNGKVG